MTRADRVIRWIEQFCVVPTGSSKGQYVRLTLADRETVARIYRDDGSLDSEPVSGELAGFLALLHVCGVEALGNGPARGVPIFHNGDSCDPETLAGGSHTSSPRMPRMPTLAVSAILTHRLCL